MKILLNYCKAFVAIFALMFIAEGLNAQAMNAPDVKAPVNKTVKKTDAQNVKDINLNQKKSKTPAQAINESVNSLQQKLNKYQTYLATATDPKQIAKIQANIDLVKMKIDLKK